MTVIMKCNCGIVGEASPINGMTPDLPTGWASLTLAGLPVRNWLLCPGCVRAVQNVLIDRLVGR